MNHGIRRGVKGHIRALSFYGKHDNAHRLTKAGRFQRLANDRRACLDQDLFDLKRALPIHRRIEKIHHVRTHESLRDSISGEGIGQHNRIGARGKQMLFGIFLAGPGDDLQIGIHSSRGEDDIDIDSIRGGCSHQTFGVFDAHLFQNVLMGSVAHLGEPALIAIAQEFGFVRINHDEGHRLACQFTRNAAAHAPRTANDVVTRQTVDIALHAPPAEDRLQLEF